MPHLASLKKGAQGIAEATTRVALWGGGWAQLGEAVTIELRTDLRVQKAFGTWPEIEVVEVSCAMTDAHTARDETTMRSDPTIG